MDAGKESRREKLAGIMDTMGSWGSKDVDAIERDMRARGVEVDDVRRQGVDFIKLRLACATVTELKSTLSLLYHRGFIRYDEPAGITKEDVEESLSRADRVLRNLCGGSK